MKTIAAILFCLLLSHANAAVPAGASALNYTVLLIDEHPVAADIAPTRNGVYKWYSTHTSSGSDPTDLTNYYTTNISGTVYLAMDFPGTNAANQLNLRSVSQDLTQHSLPLLDGSRGFYVEFDIMCSTENTDHWASVWLEPVEYNYPITPTACYYPWLYPADASNYSRWMELDVEESGSSEFYTNMIGTVHNMQGVLPPAVNTQQTSPHTFGGVFMNVPHTFGASFNPLNKSVSFWLDGVFQATDSSNAVPLVARLQHFYLLLTTYSHGHAVPYIMYISGVRAYGPDISVVNGVTANVGTWRSAQ